MIDHNRLRQTTIPAGLRVLLLAVLACSLGCAGTGVSARSVEAAAVSLADAELYHRSKIEGDRDMRANLRDAWSALAKIEGELALERARTGDAVTLVAARSALETMHADLVAAGKKISDIADRQGQAEAHYQALRTQILATVGLIRALADRDAAEQALGERGAQAASAAGSVLRQAATASATGGVVR